MLKLKKSLGQNFLIDKNIANKISKLDDIFNQNIFEIGPGSGNLTDIISKKKPKTFSMVEKDKKFYKILKEKYYRKKNFEIINDDILEYDLNNYKQRNVIIFGNLPYNISTQILAKFIKIKIWPPFYKKIIFMFQSEVADKILARSKTNKFGRITILSNLRLEVIDSFKISKKSFFPEPKVDSKIIVFKPKDKIKFNISNIENLEKITQIFFSSKRKMINKAFKKIFKNYEEIAFKLNINLKSRPSDLPSETYYKLTEIFEKNNKI